MTVNPSLDVAATASTIADPVRAAMLVALSRADRLAATDLAAAAGVSASAASRHFGRLVRGGLLTVERQGRLRYFRLSGPRVSRAIDALVEAAGASAASTDVGSESPDHRARMCYDHLAGRLGVELTQSLSRERLISSGAWKRRPTRGAAYGTTKRGVEFLQSFGIDPRAVRAQPRSYAHACLDRTERRPHLAGSLGAAVAWRLFDLGWIERLPGTRALRITPAGRRGIKTTFGVEP
jgi:DNA-binding transcriptional ArsR family regulator